MKPWHVRAVRAADLGRLADWLPPGAALDLPGDEAGEHWLLAQGMPGADGAELLDPNTPASCDAVPVACLRLRRAIGLDRLRHWYHVGCVVHAASALKLFHRQHTLLLGNDHTGASELADLACDTAALTLAEQADVLRRLVQAALLLIARERELYSSQLIVELPGLQDTTGQSPFWEGLGRHFYNGDPQQAARQFGPAWRTHVAALLPRQPVYTSFLPSAAQEAIAQARPAARVLMDTLALEGLRYGHHVTIDDAGPVYEARIDTLRSVLGAQRRVLACVADHTTVTRTQSWLLAADGGVDVRTVRGYADRQMLHVVGDDVAGQTGLDEGAAVWAVALGD